MPGTVKSELLSYADRITKCERQEKGRGGGAHEDGDLSAFMLFCKSSFTAGHLEDIVQKSVTDLIRCLGSVSDGAGIEVDQAAALFIEESGVGGDLYCGSGNSESFDVL